MMPEDDEQYLRASQLDEQWVRSIETATGYFEKTGRLPSMAQLRYWYRGSATKPRLPNPYLEQAMGVASEEVGVNLAYRYTVVLRVEGEGDRAGRPYEIEWTLQYYAPYKESIRRPLDRERRASREVLRYIAEEKGSWIPDSAVSPNLKAERVPTGYVREKAYLKITDARRRVTGRNGEETSYEKVFVLDNSDVLRRIKELLESGQLV